ncbi:MAG: hypothetical protein ACJASQ_001473 [Crocinitomicaceae bacterium]|jgi:uncharacterized protein YndB with AHSA1/START domain
MKDVIIKEQVFKHSIDAVWKAISTQEEISTWFIKADFQAKEGYQYTFTASEERGCLTINGEVKIANPYKLAYTWIVEGTTAETTVTWNLEQVENGTKLVLEHSGISNYSDEETVLAMFDSFSGGWSDCISQLSKYLKEPVNVEQSK